MMSKPKVGISSCLLGDEVRYDGGHKRDPLLAGILAEQVEWVPVCPEIEVGMGVPREPVRLVGGPSCTLMVAEGSGRDWTSEMESFCMNRVEALSGIGIGGFVLKSGSPSCGLSVPLYNNDGVEVGRAPGLFARILKERLPSTAIIEDEELGDGDAWEIWMNRIRSAARGLTALFLTALLCGCQQRGSESELAGLFQDAATRIIQAVETEGRQYERLVELCEGIGPRLPGSDGDAASRIWAESAMRDDGLENVRQEQVSVPHWVRGDEEARLVGSEPGSLRITALGLSVATPEGGLEADITAVSSFEELQTLPEQAVAGTIVLFNYSMERTSRDMSGYGDAVRYRSGGPAAAARKGALACLVRSVGTGPVDNLHTGITSYEEGVTPIPAAALTMADSDEIERMYRDGEAPRMWMSLEVGSLPDAIGANVIGEIRGREKPEEVVVIGGHLDAWDLGQGAHDDGAGCVEAMEAARILLALGLRPRRTIRVVLFAAEEVGGLSGGRGYLQAHLDEVDGHVAAIESDSGAGPLFGFSAGGTTEEGYDILRKIIGLLGPTGASELRAPGGGGPDIGPLADRGVPVLGLWPDVSLYFDYHHSEEDAVGNVVPELLADCTAAMAVMAYVLAEMELPLPREDDRPPLEE